MSRYNTALCSNLYCFFMLWRWKAAVSSPGFPPSPGFPEASPAKAKSLVASHLMMHVVFPCHATACQPYPTKIIQRTCKRFRLGLMNINIMNIVL